eukprot:Platyproteum_vivax@DN11532_c0_g1_i1.p1
MNVYRLGGDMLHLFSFFLLLMKLRKSKSCIGVSCRTQEVYLIVFLCRYVDLLWSFISLYNSAMKVIFVSSTVYLIYLMRVQPPISQTYDRNADGFRYELYLVPTAAVISLFTSENFSAAELLWTFSIWLESVAIIPQLVLLQQLREVENLTSHYVVAMGLYR